MKFGKLFLAEQRREWAEQYIDYEQLKSWIEQSKEMRMTPADAQREFIALIAEQCRKAHGFSVSQISILQEADSQPDPEASSTDCYTTSEGTESDCETDPLVAHHRRRPLPSLASDIEEVQSFRALNMQALAKITKKFHKNFQGARLPLSALVALLEHGEDRGSTELVVHTEDRVVSDSASRRVWFAADPVVSLHVYAGRTDGQIRMEVRYTVPWWAWVALATLAVTQAPMQPALLYMAHSVDSDVDSEALLMQTVVQLVVSFVCAGLWGLFGQCDKWGGESAPLFDVHCLQQVLPYLAAAGAAHMAHDATAVLAAERSRGSCPGEPDSVCPPASLLSLSPLLLILSHRLWGEAVHWPEAVGALVIAIGSSVPLLHRTDNASHHHGMASVYAVMSSLSFAVELLCYRRVTELAPALCIMIQSVFSAVVGVAVTATSTVASGGHFGLWESGSAPDAGLLAGWCAAALLSWFSSCLVFFSLRHVTILVSSASVAAASLTGLLLVAPHTNFNGAQWDEPDSWRAAVMVGSVWIGAVAMILAQLLLRSRVEVPVREAPPAVEAHPAAVRAVSPKPRERRRQRRRGKAMGAWKSGDVLGFVADVDRRRIYLGHNGQWRYAFELPLKVSAAAADGTPSDSKLTASPSGESLDAPHSLRGFHVVPEGQLAVFPALTAGKGTTLHILPPGNSSDSWEYGPPKYPALTLARRQRVPAADAFKVIRGPAGSCQVGAERRGRVPAVFSDFATVGAPALAFTSGWCFFEVKVVKAGESAQFGWAAAGSTLLPRDGPEPDPADPSHIDDGVGDDSLSWGVDGLRAGAEGCWRWTAGDILRRPWPLDPTESATGATTPVAARLQAASGLDTPRGSPAAVPVLGSIVYSDGTTK
eukprot:TRINITY_DN2136_c1_g2_i1.p1 TRINITY_DN2136_c1_g2~~TRINITY_DN2136_c1_g2_i1.p1  ORF type:complete len:879 (+),score=283.77 TRINITY_DN2136_c1_g2_i1:21-2657(+)